MRIDLKGNLPPAFLVLHLEQSVSEKRFQDVICILSFIRQSEMQQGLNQRMLCSVCKPLSPTLVTLLSIRQRIH